jgi:hypothetical protein
VKNDRDAYTQNNITAKKNDDGSVTIQFGGCDAKSANCIPITPGWNYWVRLSAAQRGSQWRIQVSRSTAGE